ncbi:tRNA modification GTPase MnmE [Candidatus Magnetomoraceae bacterium gMMP-15]
MHLQSETIAAIATPVGPGGIGIVKISGPQAIRSVLSIFQGSKKKIKYIKDIHSHLMYHGYIVSSKNEKIIDEVLLVVMKAPYSYTGEDVAEIHAHGSNAALRAILELLLKNKNIRLSEPGEFTKRAFLNGKIDLTRAEAVIDIISARTKKALDFASSQLAGELQNKVESIRESLVKILTNIEAAIDFYEEIEDFFDPFEVISDLEKQSLSIKKLINQYDKGYIYKEGVQAVIAGKPNVGKSSLMNCLLKKKRSIVTTIPGTTRDIIEDAVNISGIPLVLADTAGLHNSNDEVESIGINLTKERLANADIIIFVLDASEPLTNEDMEIYTYVRDKKVVLAANKSDLCTNINAYDIPVEWGLEPVIISALHSDGIDLLKDAVFKKIIGMDHGEGMPSYVPNLRHKTALEHALENLECAVKALQDDTEPDLVAIDIRAALDSLGEITGITTNEDVLDRIFSNFCIGK